MPANEDHNAAGWALYSAPTRDAAMLEKAIAHFEAALVENPDAGTALSNLLDALLAAGREFEAVARAGLHAGVDRGSSRANNWLGWYYLNTKKDLPRALECRHRPRLAPQSPRSPVPMCPPVAARADRGDRRERMMRGRDVGDALASSTPGCKSRRLGVGVRFDFWDRGSSFHREEIFR